MAKTLPETITFLDLPFQKLPSNTDLFSWNHTDYAIYYCPGVTYLLFKKHSSCSFVKDCHFIPFWDFVIKEKNYKLVNHLLELVEPYTHDRTLMSGANTLESLEEQVNSKAKKSGKDIYLFHTQPQGFLE